MSHNGKRVNIKEIGALLANTAQLFVTYQQHNVIPYILGYVNKEPLLLLMPQQKIVGAPNVLIAAGFHGDEIAGPLAIIQHLANNKHIENVNISYLPVVSTSATKRGTHLNEWEENVNRGFCNQEAHPLSKEGVVLLGNIELLHLLAKDGYLALHEDVNENSFYAYTRGAQQKKLESALRRTGRKFFALNKRDTQEGIITDDYANSFEDIMNRKRVPYIACTETPGCKTLKQRVLANVALIKTFCIIIKSAIKT